VNRVGVKYGELGYNHITALAFWEADEQSYDAGSCLEKMAEDLENKLRAHFKTHPNYAKNGSTDAKGGGAHDLSNILWSVTYVVCS